jgi:hypothetical protein
MASLVRIEPAMFRADEAWFVFDDGRKYLRKREAPEARTRAPAIMRDSIELCRGPDGRMHDSLASYRRSLRADGNPQGENYTEIGNERLTPVEHKFDRKQRRDDIRAGLEDVRNGRVPPMAILED